MKKFKNSKYILLALIILIQVSFTFFVGLINNRDIGLEKVNLKETIGDTFLAFYVEQENGEYAKMESDVWPTNMDFNIELSGCIDSNGNTIKNALTYDKKNRKVNVETDRTTQCYLYFNIKSPAYAIYSETDNSFRFYKNRDTVNVGDVYEDRVVTEIYNNIESLTHTAVAKLPWSASENLNNIKTIEVVDKITPLSTVGFFMNMKNASYIDVTNIDATLMTNATSMFEATGYNLETVEIKGLDTWNTSSLKYTTNMFQTFAYSANSFDIDLSNWNIENTINMSRMFYNAGYSSEKWNIGDISNWDTKNVTDMSFMFAGSGYNVDNFSINGIDKLDTSNVTTMQGMFGRVGYNSHTLELDLNKRIVTREDGSTYTAWDTKNVTNMQYMFTKIGSNVPNLKISGLSTWILKK